MSVLKNRDLAKKLMKPPPKDKGPNMPKIVVLKPNAVHQADLLFMPSDKGYRYLLVVVDCHSRKIDAEPLKNKQAETVKDAFTKIYNRKILELPQRIDVDDGSEFKGQVIKFFERNETDMRFANPQRHRQQAFVERYNQIISVKLFEIMIAKQLETGKINGQWIDNYRGIINEINKKAKPIDTKTQLPHATGQSANLLEIGTQVRRALDAPIETTGEKLHGKFRSVDIRHHPEIRTIKEIVLRPFNPPLYLLNDLTGKRDYEPVGYTRNQLQIV